MWALNKGDWPWLLMGFIGAIIAGGCFPAEGVFIAHVQVHTVLIAVFCCRCGAWVSYSLRVSFLLKSLKGVFTVAHTGT